MLQSVKADAYVGSSIIQGVRFHTLSHSATSPSVSITVLWGRSQSPLRLLFQREHFRASRSARLLSDFLLLCISGQQKTIRRLRQAVGFRNSFLCWAWDSPASNINVVIGSLLGMPIRRYHQVFSFDVGHFGTYCACTLPLKNKQTGYYWLWGSLPTRRPRVTPISKGIEPSIECD